MRAVAFPGDWEADPRSGRERFYRRGAGPSQWLLAVVDFDAPMPRVVTAYASRKAPKGWRPQ